MLQVRSNFSCKSASHFPHKARPRCSVDVQKKGRFSLWTRTHSWIQFIGILLYVSTALTFEPRALLWTIVSEKNKMCNKKKKKNEIWNGEVWNYSRSMTSASRSCTAAPHTHPAALFLLRLSLHLILPEDFNLLPRLPSHNFFKSTFYETAIPFHRRPCTVNPICEASYAVTLTWQKCQSGVLCFALAHIIASWSIL